MIKEQIDIEILVADVEPVLPPDEGESLAQFEQEFLQMTDKRGFEFAFMEWLRRG